MSCPALSSALADWGISDDELIVYASSMLEDVRRGDMDVEAFVVAVCIVPFACGACQRPR